MYSVMHLVRTALGLKALELIAANALQSVSVVDFHVELLVVAPLSTKFVEPILSLARARLSL